MFAGRLLRGAGLASAATASAAATWVLRQRAPVDCEEKSVHGMGKLPKSITDLPIEHAKTTMAPNVPPPITRRHPARVLVDLESTVKIGNISRSKKYEYWTFNDGVPGPFIRVRVGDSIEVRHTNNDSNGIAHNIDFHAVTGPGGGTSATFAEQGQTKTGIFKMLYPGLYIYHCAAEPVASHIANGMYGLILVEPEEGLPHADVEYYVMQSEFYAESPGSSADDPNLLEFSFVNGLKEDAQYVVFNGREGSLVEKPLVAKQGQRVRLFVGNAGPNLISSFHVIGCIFDTVYLHGSLMSPPIRGVQTTLIPAGGAAVVEIDTSVPGNFTLVDHSIFRIEKGAVGFLKVTGPDAHEEIFHSTAIPTNCPNCKLHS